MACTRTPERGPSPWTLLGLSRSGVWSLLWLLAVTTAPAAALGQSITLQDSAIERTGEQRDSTDFPLAVSRQDCEENVTYSFTVTMKSFSGLNYEVWVGAGSEDCSVEGTRVTTPTCWMVHEQAANKETTTIEIPAQALLGISPAKSIDGALASCTPTDESNTERQKMTMYFLLIATGSEEKANDTYELEYDLLGPPPPTEISAGVGEQQIPLSWKVDGANTDTSAYRFYCTPNSSDNDKLCRSSSLVPAELPSEEDYCGRVDGSTASSGIARSGIQNGQSYTVAVAAEDALGNVGVLSDLDCVTPAEVSDFYETYRDAGGEGGGGLCSVSEGQRGTYLGALGMLATLSLARLGRRRTLPPSARRS